VVGALVSVGVHKEDVAWQPGAACVFGGSGQLLPAAYKVGQQRLDALIELPLAERADALGAVYDELKDMLDLPEPE